MVASSLMFRELDKKWFLLENKKDIKRMNKLFRLKKNKFPLLVYTYIDHEFGLSLRVIGTIEVEEGKASLDKKFIDNKLDIVRYSEIENLELSPVDEKIVKGIQYTDQVEEEMDGYYAPYVSMIETRGKRELDEYRDPIQPDNVQFLMIDREHQKEFLEGRIEDYDSEKDYYICTLLDDPRQDFDIEAGELVVLKFIDRPNYKGLAFIKKQIEDNNNE